MKMRTFILIAMLLLLGQVCWGQEIGAPQTGGTRAFSMGGVYTATNRGIDALSGNPGGLALLENAQFLVGGRVLLMGKADLEEDYYKDYYDLKDYSSKFGINPKLLNVGIAFPITLSGFSHKLVGAVGYRSFYDLSENEIREFEDQSDNKYEETENERGLINVLSFGVGTTISEKYSFGLSFNLPLIKGYKYESEQEIKYTGGTTKYEEEAEYDVSGGSFIQLGGIVQVTPELSIGASYTMSHKFELEDGKYTDKEDGDVVDEGDLYDIKYESPAMYSIGFSYRVAPDFLISAELQNRPWEDVEVNGKELSNLESGSSYRFGIEYGSDVLLRAGLIMERAPIIDLDKDGVNFKGVTGGIGYKSNNIMLDVGGLYVFTSFDGAKVGTKTYDINFNQLMVFATLIYSFEFSIDK